MDGTAFCPYADPFRNIYDLEPKRLRSVTYELFHNIWRQKLESSKKSTTYRSFKDNMKFEPYLLHTNRKERVAMTKLRVSDHKLMIEVGRHRQPSIPQEERTCYMCNDKVEDEIHFLTECRLYGSKNQFWQKVQTKFPQTANLDHKAKFIFLMTQEDPETTKLTMETNKEWQNLRTFLCDYFYQEKE